MKSKITDRLIEATKGMSVSEIGEVIYELNKDYYEEKPVDIETFIKDNYFLGKLWASEEGETEFFPFWLDKLKKLHPSPFIIPYNECILSLPIGCQTGDTIIETNLGSVSLEEMFENRKHKEYYVNSEHGFNKVNNVYCNGGKYVYLIVTKSGRVFKTSSEHRFRVLDSNGRRIWIEAEKLNKGDLLVCEGNPSPMIRECDAKNKYRLDFHLLTHRLMHERKFFNDFLVLENSAQPTQSSDVAISLPTGVIYSFLKLLNTYEKRLEFVSYMINNYGNPLNNSVEIISNEVLCRFLAEVCFSLGLNVSANGNKLTLNLDKVGIVLKSLDIKNKSLIDLIKSSECSPDMSFTDEVVYSGLFGFETVYDLNVDVSHTYCTKGVITHNSGKSICSLTSISYMLYLLLCLKDPQTYYGIRPAGTQIIFTLFSASKSLAEEDDWGRLASMIEGCTWFKDRGIKPTSKSLKYDPTVILAKDVGITIGTSSAHALGKAVFGGIMDEANFLNSKNTKAKEAYLAVSRRMESRFMQTGGSIPGMLFLASSPKFATSFLNERIEASKNSKKTFVVSNTPIWEVKHHLNLYSGETFPVFVGDDFNDPTILNGNEVSKKDPSLVIRVPMEYHESFTKDILESMRDIVGLSITGAQSFFRSKNAISIVSTVPHRFSREIIELDFTGDREQMLMFADLDYFRNPAHTECWRFIHIDLSATRDRTGIASVYCVPERIDEIGPNGEMLHRTERMYFVDFAIGIQAKQNEEVPHYKIEEFLVWLKRNGYPIYSVSFDQYQSRTTMQNLRLKGFTTKYVSVDVSRDPYVGLRSAIFSRNILLPRNNLLIEELSNLQDDGVKIDHLPHLSKDVSDGVAGAYFSCQQSDVVLNARNVDLGVNLQNKSKVREFLKNERFKNLGNRILPSSIRS